jgi:putative transposase
MRLDDPAIKAIFLNTITRAKKKHDFRIDTFTVMGNHYHLIIKPLKNANLSRIMQWIMSVFAMTYNRIYKLKGHLWQDRFYSRIIQSLRELIELFKYIDENPVRAGLATRPIDWPFGGLAHRLARIGGIVDPPDDLTVLWAVSLQIAQHSNRG